MTRLRVAFVSPVFLFPADAGGKIRTGNILRGLKESGRFDITLLSPAAPEQQRDWQAELDRLCERFIGWAPSGPRPRWQRAPDLLSPLPINVVADRTPAALQAVEKVLAAERFDVVVFDFVHAAVLRPRRLGGATVCFTHNVEAEIFERHARTAASAPLRWLWASQAAKMRRFEREALAGFTRVVAVSERDAKMFAENDGLTTARAIPTGVDLDFFSWQAPADGMPTVVFTGSMDWEANVDGIRFYLEEVWPLVRARVPDAQLRVVGKNPPASLVQRNLPGVSFTGFVDDVRDHTRDAQAFVIPLRVGGGTRIKAFEAMAMGLPVVSTTIGIEGLDVDDGVHFLRADGVEALADATCKLLADAALRLQLSRAARELVEVQFGHRVAAEAFGRILIEAVEALR
ncbi:glycosyltransferase family 4 protein [Roseateles saccharophilus]|uniref:Glycosyltransferase involved in cell wall biosynthesis n=1 Tax=Roseateles saccharophilus TaxID=304 RepID=A0A4R3UI47_ROSSA|nr:glycosyltransferase family 4 protein [Roseateles saccharophilus]MDG0835187.1 glycosyltransferase [Roseateles saccharophilus]TCU87828.1 glycosyltransferase involved in cell wall biosynthesis [Roseateles saccharophilus]